MDVGASPVLYELLAEMGQGSFGKVYKARELGERGRLLTVKKFQFCSESSLSSGNNGIPPHMLREVALLCRMKYFDHPNVVKLLDAGAMLVGKVLDLTLVLEYIDQDLSTYLSRASPSGLSRDDIKVVTLWYRAPEVLLNSVYMSSVDVWSAGCIFAELFLLKPLFKGFSEAQQLQMIFEFIGLPGEDEWPQDSPVAYSLSLGPKEPSPLLLLSLNLDERDLLLQCLTFTPSRRISAAGALAHPFFSQH
ncbi:cyclin-dependent kinase 4 isoform X2 [Phyllopteryx taeniolatus]|uniref:cyclin-dependent kinase 4 isoform X2 n=1 Tax=Phyllopteryx taeniolatus TaxID=161469 RepID=UPI002AD4D9D1|nr:cyclin-dependent kinase 4 isoform X2 [Phyllopteryx taeniolatus]